MSSTKSHGVLVVEGRGVCDFGLGLLVVGELVVGVASGNHNQQPYTIPHTA